jgi:hypothetical protein
MPFAAALLALLVDAAPGVPASVHNAQITVKTTHGTLPSEIAALRDPAWVGYAVRVRAMGRRCCYDDWGPNGPRPRNGSCRLEGRKNGMSVVEAPASPDLDRAVVLLRVEGGRVGRVAVYSLDCPVDAGGRRFVWLDQVGSRESLALLGPLADGSVVDHDEALAAIASHDDPEADVWLERFVAPGRPREQREQAAFWMGEARGRAGLTALQKMVREDKDARFREDLTFAISVSDLEEATDELIRMARHDGDGDVRGQALFWLAQKAGAKARAEITRAIAEDPETEVKKKAVFALSEMPDGVPILIQLARTNPNPAVREQAYFWLGQSEDRRALDFITEVLRR